MPIPRRLLDLSVPDLEHDVDERWTMAYAAGLDDHLEAYFDTARAGHVVAHPLFPVCVEWPVIVSSRQASEALGVTRAEVLTSVHADHDLTIHRLVRPGDTLTTSLEFVGLQTKRSGTMGTTRLRTVDQTGAPVATTTQNGIYLGVPLEDGGDIPDPEPPTPLPQLADFDRCSTATEHTISLSAGAAHVYTETARIWNPIHTDPVVARAAGLPNIILHGTATLAHGVSTIVGTVGGRRPELVRRVVGRFSAMVELPSTITVRVWPAIPHDTSEGTSQTVVPFDVLNEAGHPAVSNGAVVLGEPT